MKSAEPEFNANDSDVQGHQPVASPRKVLVFALLAILIVGHGYCVLTRKEYWPFSHYPMYSFVHRATWADEFLYGTTKENPERQIPISFFVFDRPISAKASLDRMTLQFEADPQKPENLRQALLGLGKIYMDKRGGHRPYDFHEICAISLVKIRWNAVRGEGRIRAEEIDRHVVMQVDLPAETFAAGVEGGR